MERSHKTKIALWGATGLTVREILNQALDDGHEVKAVFFWQMLIFEKEKWLFMMQIV